MKQDIHELKAMAGAVSFVLPEIEVVVVGNKIAAIAKCGDGFVAAGAEVASGMPLEAFLGMPVSAVVQRLAEDEFHAAGLYSADIWANIERGRERDAKQLASVSDEAVIP